MGTVTQTVSISDISLRLYQAKMGPISHSNNWGQAISCLRQAVADLFWDVGRVRTAHQWLNRTHEQGALRPEPAEYQFLDKDKDWEKPWGILQVRSMPGACNVLNDRSIHFRPSPIALWKDSQIDCSILIPNTISFIIIDLWALNLLNPEVANLDKFAFVIRHLVYPQHWLDFIRAVNSSFGRRTTWKLSGIFGWVLFTGPEAGV